MHQDTKNSLDHLDNKNWGFEAPFQRIDWAMGTTNAWRLCIPDRFARGRPCEWTRNGEAPHLTGVGVSDFFLSVQNIEHIEYEKWRCKHLRYFTSKLYVNLQFTIRSDYKALWPESRNAMREKDARCKLKLKWCQDFECSNWIQMIQGWTSWFCVDISVGGFQLPEMVERRDFQRSLIDSQVGCCGVADEKPVIGCLC